MSQSDDYPAMTHVTSLMEQQGYTVTGINRNRTVPCPCGHKPTHYISLTYLPNQKAVYVQSGRDNYQDKNGNRVCPYSGENPYTFGKLLKALNLTPDDLWDSGAWHTHGNPIPRIPYKPTRIRAAEQRAWKQETITRSPTVTANQTQQDEEE